MDKKKAIVVGVAGLVLLTSLFSRNPKPVENEVDSSLYNSQLQKLFGINGEGLTPTVIQEGDASNRILVIPIEGVIGVDSALYNHQHILDSIEQVRQEPSIKAILLSIDTGGGGVYATREIYDRIKEIQAETDVPVYASMGSVAASGGYYLAALGEKIFANPETITGSISVLRTGYNISGLLEKIGVEPVVYKTGEFKDMGSDSRPATEEEKEIFQALGEESFDRFVEVVAEGRQMSEDRVRELADGRVYTGKQAKENGLIDEFGYEKDALQTLMADKNLEGAEVIVYDQSQDFGSLFSNIPLLGQLAQGQNQSPANQIKEAVETLESLNSVKLEYRLQGGN